MLPLYVSDVPLSCINIAAIEQHIPAKLIISILNIERGKVGQAVRNTNGTYDLGPLQINSRWLPEFEKHGISREAIQNDPCINVRTGAWILAKSIASEENLLLGVGDYHSHTLRFNSSYTRKVRINFTKLDIILRQSE